MTRERLGIASAGFYRLTPIAVTQPTTSKNGRHIHIKARQ